MTSGLQPGERVVMTGVDKLQEGSKVAVHFQGEKRPHGQGAGQGQGAGKAADGQESQLG